MKTAISIRGRMLDARHIALEEPVNDIRGPVEVVLHAVTDASEPVVRDVFAFIASLSPGTRSKEDIDQQLAEERSSWGDR